MKIITDMISPSIPELKHILAKTPELLEQASGLLQPYMRNFHQVEAFIINDAVIRFLKSIADVIQVREEAVE